MRIREMISRVKTMSRRHIALIIFLICLTLFLSARASDEFRWSDWGFGDAQTMLSLKQWEEGGWFSNYFLFIPQGYARVVHLFDDPQLRQHAHGTCPGSSPRIGPRLWYTHYPAGYLTPYAVFFRLGLDGLFEVRMLSIAFSIAALVLMYLVFASMTSPRVALLAVVFYGLTPTFLGYADTLANQPLDDMLRFGFMLAIVLSTRAASSRHRRLWTFGAWAMEFMLSLSSFDSVFFIYLWIIGWDILDRQGFRWKRYLIFSLAPLTAHGLQFLQNVWYLGFGDALIDIRDAFLLKNAADPGYNAGQGRLGVIMGSIGILLNNLYTPGIFIAVMLGLYVIYNVFLKDRDEQELPAMRILIVLFFCGMAFIMILPHAARMPYESRQMIPFVSLLASSLAWSFFVVFKSSVFGINAGESLFRKILRPAYLLLTACLLLVFSFQFLLNNRRPVYYIPDAETDAQFARAVEAGRYDLAKYHQLREEVLFATGLRNVPTASEPVYFSLEAFRIFWDPKYVAGYPQIMPITEYYTGSRPVLCFDTAERLARDLAYLVRKSPYRFSPVLVSNDKGSVDRVLGYLRGDGILTGIPLSGYVLQERYIMDLTHAVRWGGR